MTGDQDELPGSDEVPASRNQLKVDVIDGVIGVLTMNRPDVLNAFGSILMGEVDAAIGTLAADPSIRCVVLTGAGSRAFSAGGDLKELRQQTPVVLAEWARRWGEIGWTLANCTKPTIAAVNGVAFGGGALLATQCDIRIGCEQSAFRFLAATYGQVNSSWTLPMIVGWPRAMELLFTGRQVASSEALEIGLLNKVVASTELLKAAIEMGGLIAKSDPVMVQGIKALVHAHPGQTWRQMFDAENALLKAKSAPIAEGFSEFFKRRDA